MPTVASQKHTRSLRLSAVSVLILLTFFRVAAERLPLKTYTTADGLGNNGINKIVRDSRGFLWFCTFEGLSRFDGYTFTTYGVTQGLARPVINDLLETREGKYWVATGAGLYFFNPKGIPQRGTSSDLQSNSMFTVFYPGADASSNSVEALV